MEYHLRVLKSTPRAPDAILLYMLKNSFPNTRYAKVDYQHTKGHRKIIKNSLYKTQIEQRTRPLAMTVIKVK
jgi:hypothetical protein